MPPATPRVTLAVLLGACCSVPLALAIGHWQTAADRPSSAIESRRPVEPAVGLDQLTGRVVGADPVLALPTSGFSLVDESRWQLDGDATMRVEVRTALPYLAVRLHGVEGGSIELSWDGSTVPVVGVGDDGVATARISGGRLSVGHHRLELRPTADGHDPVSLAAVAFRHGTWGRSFSARWHRRHHLIGRFLDRGVAAAHNRETLGGVLFDGPHRHRLVVEGGGRLSWRLHNASPTTARFRVLDDAAGGGTPLADVALEAFEQRDLIVDLPASTDTVSLRADGTPSGLFLWGATHRHVPQAATTPVLWIVLDTVRRDGLGAYAPEVRWTPRLDALAATSTVYESAHSTAPWTLPAHASMFTGLYPSTHRAGVTEDSLATVHPTIAERLRDAGWTTGGFVGGFLASDRFGLGRGFGVFRHPGGAEAGGGEVTEAALAFLAPRIESRFFLFVNLFDAHFPYRPDVAVAGPAQAEIDAIHAALGHDTVGRRLAEGERRAMRRLMQGDVAIDEPTTARLRELYDHEIATLDHQVGRLLDALHDSGRFDEALILVTSDHGELFGEAGHYFHSHRLDPALIEIPLLIKFPHQTTSQRVAEPVSLVDLYATVLDAVGLPPGETRDGLSLLDRDARSRRPAVIAEEHDLPLHRLHPAVRHAEHAWSVWRPTAYSIVWRDGATCGDRPTVDAPWSSSECRAPRSRDDRAILERLVGPLAPPSPRSPEPAADDRARLEALGYLDPAP